MSIHDPSKNPLTEKLEGLGLGGGDCFSDLPDDLLVDILSFLSTEEAVRTSTVSKRWKRLWVRVPSLIIEIRHPTNGLRGLDRGYGLVFLEAAMGLHASPNGKVAWTTLRVLDVADTTWSDDLVAKLLAGCPALESLRLRRFRGIRRIDATSATKLKELVIECCMRYDSQYLRDGNLELSICAPHLQELKLIEAWLELSPVLINVDSLVKAEFDFMIVRAGRDRYRNTLLKLLGMVRQCEELKVGTFCLQDLSTIENDPFRALLSSPKHVIVHIGYSIYRNPLGLYNLFQCFPTLERLTVDLFGVREEDLTWPPSCLLSNLRVVKLFGIVIVRQWVKIAEFLLKNSPILEKMVICSYSDSSAETKDLRKAIEDLQRSSSRAIVIFHRDHCELAPF